MIAFVSTGLLDGPETIASSAAGGLGGTLPLAGGPGSFTSTAAAGLPSGFMSTIDAPLGQRPASALPATDADAAADDAPVGDDRTEEAWLSQCLWRRSRSPRRVNVAIHTNPQRDLPKR
jgi:hypothetical protein